MSSLMNFTAQQIFSGYQIENRMGSAFSTYEESCKEGFGGEI